jgi:4'-phosphopantetheinyl transferase
MICVSMVGPRWVSKSLDWADAPGVTAVKRLTPDDAPAGVEVWLLKLALSLDLASFAPLLAALSDAERQRCLRLRRSPDRLRFACTRMVLRRLLAARLKTGETDICLEMGPFGKPQLAYGLPLHFNLSHAGRYALIALSTNGEVGVDIEAVTAEADILSGVLTRSELQYCSESRSGRALFQIWSGKEAVLKAWGVGVAEHLPCVSVVPATPKKYKVTFHQAGPQIEAWLLSVPGKFTAALAVQST